MNEIQQLQQQVQLLKNELDDLRYILHKKIGGGSADIKGNIANPSSITAATVADSSITNAKMADDAIKQAELDYEVVAVTVSAGAASGTGTATSGSIIIGWRPTGNIDQFVDNVAISGTTITITLGANATADNTFSVTLLKA